MLYVVTRCCDFFFFDVCDEKAMLTSIYQHSHIFTVCFSGEGRFAVKSSSETKLDVCVRQMVWYHGKCAGCGVGKNHKNFKGRRSGYTIPDPCYVELRKRRKAVDDRLCCRCYEAHLAKIPKEPTTPAPDKATRSRSRTSSLDGVAWSETASERVAKMARRSIDGDCMIPLDLHEKKLAEQAAALRHEAAALLQLKLQQLDEVELQDDIASVFRRGDVSPADLGRIFQRVVEYYKQGPSADRAQRLRGLGDQQKKNMASCSKFSSSIKSKSGRPKMRGKFGNAQLVYRCMNPRRMSARNASTNLGATRT